LIIRLQLFIKNDCHYLISAQNVKYKFTVGCLGVIDFKNIFFV
jgi:hypothetical protein